MENLFPSPKNKYHHYVFTLTRFEDGINVINKDIFCFSSYFKVIHRLKYSYLIYSLYKHCPRIKLPCFPEQLFSVPLNNIDTSFLKITVLYFFFQ